MSLFESKIWWTTKLSPNVEYDQYHLAVGRFGGSEESNRVVVGGYDGLIKVYEPRESGYKPSHAILEKAEGRPILQVLGGKLDENSEEDVLAVLFANGFVVYSFHQGQEGLMLKNEGRDDSITRLCYNMTFCYMADETLLAIQTQDGLVYFYNKSSRICSFQMADIVVPSPLIFLKKKKSLCLQNACLQMQSYKYQTIFSNQSTASSSIKPEWETTLGELALSMDQYQSSEDTLLVVGCEQHIYVLKTSNGKIDHLKRLQCIPSTVMVSPTKPDTKDLVLIVSSFSHHILFYKNFELVWATK
jgi:hypothetical protein